MRWLILFLFIFGCQPLSRTDPEVEECVIGPQMDVLKLLRTEEGKYLFVEYPYAEDSPVEIVEDVSAFRKVECPDKP
jgi:hypothetical protein